MSCFALESLGLVSIRLEWKVIASCARKIWRQNYLRTWILESFSLGEIFNQSAKSGNFPSNFGIGFHT